MATKKRGAGEGTIVKRPDGRWVGALTVGYANGHQQRKWFYGPTQRAVQEKLTKARRDLQQGLPLGSDRLTVAHFLARWLDTAAATVRPRTLESYRGHVRDYLVPAFGRLPLAKLDVAHVEALLSQLRARGRSPKSMANVRGTLRRALVIALRWNLLARNVAALATPPRLVRPECVPLSLEETRRLLTAVRGHPREALYLLAAVFGLRRGELLGLTWGDVDLDEGRLTVRQALQRVGGRLTFAAPKSAAGRRTLPLPAPVLEALRHHRRRQREARLALGPLWTEHNLVFPNSLGKPQEPGDLNREFHQILRRAGLPPKRLHDLRHGAATMLAALNVPPRTAMELLGHSTIAMTLDVYAHVTDPLKREAAEKLGALVAEPAAAVSRP